MAPPQCRSQPLRAALRRRPHALACQFPIRILSHRSSDSRPDRAPIANGANSRRPAGKRSSGYRAESLVDEVHGLEGYGPLIRAKLRPCPFDGARI
jgi:hypothetical protein